MAQILDAAAEAFLGHGVGGATMQLLAERAWASAGSLHHFFPNKDAVLESLGARYADRVRRLNEGAMPPSLVHYPRMPVPQRLASAMVSVAPVRAIVDLAGRLPAAMREPVLREGHAMLVAHHGAADAQFGVGQRPGGGAAPAVVPETGRAGARALTARKR